MKGWRTLLISLAVAIIGALETFNWTDFIPEGWGEPVILVLGVVFAWLRKVTDTALGEGE